MADHVWTVVTARNGKPARQHRCSRCSIWETAISISTECNTELAERCTFEWEDGNGLHDCRKRGGHDVHKCTCDAWWPVGTEPFFSGEYEVGASNG